MGCSRFPREYHCPASEVDFLVCVGARRMLLHQLYLSESNCNVVVLVILVEPNVRIERLLCFSSEYH